jgi:hypothetical protein
MAEYRERGDYRAAERHGFAQQRRSDLPDKDRAELAIQFALLYTQQALASPPESREALWSSAERACAEFLQDWPNNPWRLLVEVQGALVSLARGEQARQFSDTGPAIMHLRAAARRFQSLAESLERELIDRRLQPQRSQPSAALAVEELESLQANISFELGRARHQLALCYAARSADRDDALLQAANQLRPLAQRAPADALIWNARQELAACLNELGQAHSARQLVAAWLRENPPPEVRNALAGAFRQVEPTGRPANEGAVPPAAEHSYRAESVEQAVAEYDLAAERLSAAGRHDEAFRAAMAAAAIERSGGRQASAAQRYRRLALANPGHSQASESHRLAALCTAQQLRDALAEDRSALAETYEALLNEHLAHWPAQASAEDVRLWLGRLLASRRDWEAAIKILQQIKPPSPAFSKSVPLTVQCYEEQLRTAQANHEEHKRAQLLASASGHLQPIITGVENRWPDSWSEPQYKAAAALARLQLRYSADGAAYAQRLLTAALQGTPAAVEAEAATRWRAEAQVLLIEAQARSGDAAGALNTLEHLPAVPAQSILELLEQIDELLAQVRPADKREFAELALAVVRRADALQSQLDDESIRRIDASRAAALAAAGDRAAALAQFAALLAQAPNDGELQRRYASLLAASDSDADLRESVMHWKQVESRSQRGGPRWRQARRARIELLTRLGDAPAAEKLLRLTRLLYPDWDDAPAEQHR